MLTPWRTKLRDKIIFLIIVSLFFQNFTLAAEQPTLEDKAIGSTFKALARVFVAVTDINKLKKDSIHKITKMNEEKFNKKYSHAYKIIQDLPPDLKTDYSVTENMSKDQAVKNIESLDKEKIYKIINAVPDEFIALQFKRYLSDKKQATPKTNAADQINKFWNKTIKKSGAAPTT